MEFTSEWLDTDCAICGKRQYTTPDGHTCTDGHNNAKSLTPMSEETVKLHQSVGLLPQEPIILPQATPAAHVQEDVALVPKGQEGLPAPQAVPQPSATGKVSVSRVDMPTPLEIAPKLVLGAKTATKTGLDLEGLFGDIEMLQGGMSAGGISWHTIEDAEVCWRKFYYRHVLCLEPKEKRQALQIGNLWHWTMELHLRTGGRELMTIVNRLEAAGAGQMAAQLRRMIENYLGKYGQRISETWDVRSLEQNIIWWLPPIKIDGKVVYVPATSRLDMLVAEINPGEPRLPAGPHPNGVSVLDWKTAARADANLVLKYAMSGQFQQNAAVFINGGYAAQFGPLQGIRVELVFKKNEIDYVDGATDMKIGLRPDLLSAFIDSEMKPMAYEITRRVAAPEEQRRAPDNWPRCSASCFGKYGACDYISLCDVGMQMSWQFKENPALEISVDKFAPAPKEMRDVYREQEIALAEKQGKPSAAKKAAAARKARADMKPIVLEGLKEMILGSELCGHSPRSDYYFAQVPAGDRTKKSIKEALKADIAQHYSAVFAPAEEGGEARTAEIEITHRDHQDALIFTLSGTAKKTGISWKIRDLKGTLAWGAIAEYVISDWWSPAGQRTETVANQE